MNASVKLLWIAGIAFLCSMYGCGGDGSGITGSEAADSNVQLSRAGRWIVDNQGRVIIAHGIHITQKSPPYYPDFLTDADAKFLANQGFTVARIDFIWAGAEPQPGVYDDVYIGKVLGINKLLAKYGIRTLLDFHQNGWNARGGPAQWATFNGPAGSNYQYPFQAFWDDRLASDGVGIQTHFVRLWAHVAKLVMVSPEAANVIGYDPFNEPSPGVNTGCPASGAACPAFESGQLTDFYRRVIVAIRATGDQHIIWPEGTPSGQTPPSLGTFDDPLIGYNFHYYSTAAIVAGWAQRLFTSQEEVTSAQQEAQAVPLYLAQADSRNEPAFMSEFGCSDDTADINRMVDYAGRAFISWTHWQYDLDPDVKATGPCAGLVVDKNQPASLTNVKLPRLTALAVPYAQEVAGTPKSYSFDPGTRTMILTYATQPVTAPATGSSTLIFVPQLQYPQGYKVSVSGARVVSRPTAPRIEIADASASEVTVTVSPDTGSSTEPAWP